MGSKRAESVLRIVCAALMLSLGFAHKPVMAALAAPLEDAFRLPDGTFADICSEHDDSKSSPHDERKHSGDAILFCEACLLSSSILLPTPDDADWLPADAVFIDNTPLQNRETVTASSRSLNHARGPPPSFF